MHRRGVIVKADQRDADAEVMTTMQAKLHFRRNPRYNPESRSHEKVTQAVYSIYAPQCFVALVLLAADRCGGLLRG